MIKFIITTYKRIKAAWLLRNDPAAFERVNYDSTDEETAAAIMQRPPL